MPIHGDLRERFAWAVPRGHVENDDDRAIRARAAGILDDYERRRALYIGEGKSGALALLRDAFDDGHGSCSPGNWSTVGRLAVGRAGS